MDNEFLSAFKMFQKKQDMLNKALRNPAIEAMQRQQDNINRLIGNSATVGFDRYQGIASIMNNPAFRELQNQQDTWNRLIGNSAAIGLKKYQSVASVMHSPAFDNLVKHQSTINGIFKSSAFEAIQKHQDTWSRLVGNSAFTGLEKYQGITSVISNLGLDNYQNSITQVMNNSTFEILQKHQDRWSELFNKISDLGINSSTFSEMVEELQEVYDEIDSSSSVSEEENINDKEIKEVIQGIISYCMHIVTVFHVVDTKYIWDILTKISVLMTILLPLVPVDEPNTQEEKVQIINVNGDNNTINIENTDSGTIIINTGDRETDVNVIKDNTESVEEHGNKVEELEKDKLDISAGLKT
ncbi:hypothetical protein [Bacillus sp. UMB0728]|uniref:hypothetical protein n=1 Tax=Bacillus sp. UMB0728 TaxID=2066052 RepID=UPI000C77AE5F|nr:hypothetical protein [Bacillus sp. UMB0728]PLR70285.1 hypothetical protein CYJ37_25020 [Bacillus sp. UMB0728]